MPLCSCGDSRPGLGFRERGSWLCLPKAQSSMLCLTSHPAQVPHSALVPHVHEHGPAPPQPDKSLLSSVALLNQVGISQKQTNRRAQSCGFQSSDSSVCLSSIRPGCCPQQAGWGPRLSPQDTIPEAPGCRSSFCCPERTPGLEGKGGT